VAISVQSRTPGARITFRGRVHAAPFEADVKSGSELELIELTAPARQGRRFWVRLDQARRLSFELPQGSGVIDASAAETARALGEGPGRER
jgi:hypothetical protein